MGKIMLYIYLKCTERKTTKNTPEEEHYTYTETTGLCKKTTHFFMLY